MLSIVFAHFLFKQSEERERKRKKASWKRRNQGMELSHFLVRKNPNSSHVWDIFVGLNWGLMFVLILFRL